MAIGSAAVSDRTPLLLAELAEHRHRDPAAAREQTEHILSRPGLSVADKANGHWVLGLSIHELGQHAQAVAEFRVAVRLAQTIDDVDLEARARGSLAVSLLSVGKASLADREIARARDIAPESARGLVELLSALVLQRSGRHDESLVGYARALHRLRREQANSNIARLLINRGTLYAYQGHFDEALADLREAEELATELELWVLVAMAAHNRGFSEGRRGRAPEALEAFDRAEAAYLALGEPARLVAGLASDRCEVLLAVGLTSDAREAAERALTVLGESGDAAQLSESRLLLARACLAQGAHEEAAAQARLAAKAFRASRRLPWAAVADYVAMQAEVLAIEDLEGPPPPRLLTQTKKITRLLAEQGWPVEALHVGTFHARVALALDRPELARSELTGARGARASRTADLRVQGWHATALLAMADDDIAGAKRALVRGLDVIDEHRAGLAATEMRAGVAMHGRDLARLGVRLALRDGRGWEVLRWADRWRAGALRLPPVSPPADAVLTAALEELREMRGRAREATFAGEAPSGLDRGVARLEKVVRDHALRSTGRTAITRFRLDRAALTVALADATLVEYVRLDQRLFAVTVVAGRAKVHSLGLAADVVREQQYLMFALRRMLATGGSRDAAAWQATAQQLDNLLLAPLALPAGPVVLVPTGALYGLSWCALPSLADRAVTIAPSADVWLRRGHAKRAARDRAVTLVAGPDLPGADREVVAISKLYPHATVLRGHDATTTAVQAALAESQVVHLAAHGTFRADSPLFSYLHLADGPLTVYELERLANPPATVVLAACDAGRADVLAGDELLGTATAMIGLGVSTVVVPVTAVPDEATAPLMVALHDGLCHGLRPSAALAAAVSGQRDDVYARALATTFVCLGVQETPATN